MCAWGVTSVRSMGQILFVVLLAAVVARADTVITDFNSATLGSVNPRDNWFAFGSGQTDAGVHTLGSVGRGAYQEIDWATATFGAGEVSPITVDLSGYTAIDVDARLVDVGAHTGTGLLRFAIDLPGGTEWSTPSVPLSGSYQTIRFAFDAMSRTAGSGPLDLASGYPKFIIAKNGQTGDSRFDMDEIVGIATSSGGPYDIVPVVLRPPFDGDAVRAMWLYAFANNLRVDSAEESQRILDFCATEGVNRLYFHVGSILGGASTLRDNLRTFIATAHASGIRVEALIDGVNEYASLATIQSRIAEVLALHDATPADQLDDFDAVHFDMEFWLGSAWSAAANESQRQDVARVYLDNVLVGARAYLDSAGAFDIEVATDLSSHFDVSSMLPSLMLYDGINQRFIQHAIDHADSVVFMSYIDSATGLLSWTGNELDYAAGKGGRIILGADMQPSPPEVAINTYADNFDPTPYARMTRELELFHTFLSPQRLAALDGFSVFHFDGYASQLPEPRNVADLDGDGDADLSDLEELIDSLVGPSDIATGLVRDGDLTNDGFVDLRDYARFTGCFTGSGITGPVADECLR